MSIWLGRDRSNLLTNIVLVLPLLVLYELGVLLTGTLNGADLWTVALVRWLGVSGFIWLQLGLLAVLALLVAVLRRRERLDWARLWPVLGESLCYALLLGTVINLVMRDLLRIDPRLAADTGPAGPFASLVIAAGAGVHEELVFRLLLLGGLALVGVKLGLARWLAVLVAAVVSSVLFSAAHHLGALGEPFTFTAFVYRWLAGLAFAAIYRLRSFATAVYTHAFYDAVVLLWA